MKPVQLNAIFKANYLKYISDYVECINRVFDEYDVAIFMARKAICFYKALVNNNEIKTHACEIYSSRVIDYNVLDKLKGKRIAIIDDVVVKGTSLRHIMDIFERKGLSAHVLVVACESSFSNSLCQESGFDICDTFVTLEQDAIYAFAGLITEYIQASMCPFNIDQPIFLIRNFTETNIDKLLVDYGAIDVTSCLQQKYNIQNKVIFFDISSSNNLTIPFAFLPKNTIVKIRIMQKADKIILIPFVFSPSLSIGELDKLYDFIQNHTTEVLIKTGNELIKRENKFKLVNYILSELFAISFFEKEGIQYDKDYFNDIIQFSKPIHTQTSESWQKVCINTLSTKAPTNYSKFQFNDVISICYSAIIQLKPNGRYFNSANQLIKDIIIEHTTFSEPIENFFKDASLLASSVIDVFIDRGIIVPTITHTPGRILRAYKMGEYSKLDKKKIELFAAMLYEYQGMIKTSLGKTEFEKLCVLFFNAAINRGIFEQQASFDEDYYSIGYSLFGPRVSKSNIIYNANSDSALITEFCSDDPQKRTVQIKNGKYIINPIEAPQRLKPVISAFAYQYSATYHLFEQHNKQNHMTNWNMFVHTYPQFLTLKAIGNNKKNQFLSLCAELYQLIKLSDKFFELNPDSKTDNEWVIKGINSGLWKYWCFKNQALDKTTKKIFDKNPAIGTLLLYDVEPAFDESVEWDSLIDDAALLLYKAAFLINEVLKKKHHIKDFNSNDGICDPPIHSTLFSKGSYYAFFKEWRHTYETAVQQSAEGIDSWVENELKDLKSFARQQLDRCDQILEKATTKYSSIQKLLVVYSALGIFPINISEGLNELYLSGIKHGNLCKIYGLSVKESNLSDLTDLINRISCCGKDFNLSYFLLDVGKNRKIHYVDNAIQDGQVADILNSILDEFKRHITPYANPFLLISPTEQGSSFTYKNLSFVPLGEKEQAELIKALSKIPLYMGATPLYATPFIIQQLNITFQGEIMMNIENNSGIKIQQYGSESTVSGIHQGDTYNEAIPFDLESVLICLKQMNPNEDIDKIDKAIDDIKKNKKESLVRTLKSLGKHTLSLLENIAGTVIYEWLHTNSII